MQKKIPRGTPAGILAALLHLGLSAAPLPAADFLVFPFAFYTPETSLAFGASGGLFFGEKGDGNEARPSMLNGLLIATIRGQLSTMFTLMHEWPSFKLQAKAYLRSIPEKFYGTGNGTAEDTWEFFEPTILHASTRLRSRLGDHAGLGIGIEYEKLSYPEAGALLAAADPANGYHIGGLGAFCEWDSRDHRLLPNRGLLLHAGGTVFPAGFSDRTAFSLLLIDLRIWLPAFADHVLGMQAVFETSSGTPPFHRLPSLGGQNLLRGFYKGRFRDRTMAAWQGEYRIPLGRRFLATVFGGFGQVAPAAEALAPHRFHATVGIGLRFLLREAEKLTMRLDAGWGADSFGMYLLAMEAF